MKLLVIDAHLQSQFRSDIPAFKMQKTGSKSRPVGRGPWPLSQLIQN